ncbi:MAG: S41 family peptidase [Candidatus Neomarinimicrobiota bacterium]|nr:S41 family peptidase [Candidatus Neomarinimicrobiota bacterium]MEC9447870.1 S41 family peptidase [Candidatus Neomarinimicrobiota bacterium]|tara:strand:+ start:856 stop:2505 length:1650 start_codon:yes stop_codon:yes gene_type:complete
MKKYGLKIFLPIVIVTAILSLAITQSSYYRKIGKSQQLINRVYNQIFSTYVHQIDPETFTKDAINGITQKLDPFTEYMVDDEQHNINVLSKGKYGGVGIQLSYRNNTMSVVAPMDGGPAKSAGIISGDIILKVDDIDVKKFSFNEAAAKIRGEKGTKVKLTVKRFGDSDPIEFNLTRSEIIVKTVTYAGMLTESTGYIRLNRFNKNSPIELQKSISSLLNDKATSLIFDLRDNAGGLLTAAVSMLDMMIDKNTTLVSTKGRTKDSNRTFYSRRDPIIPKDIKIAILINQGSASASEIVAGSIQDLDRGIVIGQKSFGKGLVQTQYSFDDKRSIKITTARYYIPSGRFIQKRDYIDEKYIMNASDEDSIFTTIGGRIVYGNGGIAPDSTVVPDSLKSLSSQYWRNGHFYTFSQENKHNYKTFKSVENDKNLLKKFEKYIDTKDKIFLPGEKDLNLAKVKISKLDSTDSEVNKALDLLSDFYDREEKKRRKSEESEIKELLLLEFAGLFNGTEGRLIQALKNDETVQTAIDILSNNSAYFSSLSSSGIIEN